eukprot:scaffold25012_cov160-Skeletonema_menzelii.AAC.1
MTAARRVLFQVSSQLVGQSNTNEGISTFSRATKEALFHHTCMKKVLKDCYARGAVSKGDFAAALRAHKAAVDATKRAQRDAV